MKQVLVAIVLTILGVHGAFAQNQTVTYQGVTLQPGDVINFYGGIFTTGGFLTYGHSALYLGVDPQTNQRVFLDFTTTEKYYGGPAKKPERAFVGRILSEKEFWVASARSHNAFDVFRLRDVSRLKQGPMLQAARDVAIPANSFFFSRVCSTAVAAVLSQATGSKIRAWTPDGFTGRRFRKHPDLVAKILIQDLMDEHDMLLKNRLVEITRRSCVSPGSVRQAELDSLPREGFYRSADGSLPGSLGECIWVYIHLRSGERDAEKIKALSVPAQAVAIRPVQQDEQPIVVTPKTPFEAVFPRLKAFAITACRSSEQVSLPRDVYQPHFPLSFNRQLDDAIANSLSAGLSDCEKPLFYKLIEMIRAGQGTQIDAKWVGDMVAVYKPVRNTPPGPDRPNTPPPKGNGCFMQDNPFGPPYRVCPVPK